MFENEISCRQSRKSDIFKSLFVGMVTYSRRPSSQSRAGGLLSKASSPRTAAVRQAYTETRYRTWGVGRRIVLPISRRHAAAVRRERHGIHTENCGRGGGAPFSVRARGYWPAGRRQCSGISCDRQRPPDGAAHRYRAGQSVIVQIRTRPVAVFSHQLISGAAYKVTAGCALCNGASGTCTQWGASVGCEC